MTDWMISEWLRKEREVPAEGPRVYVEVPLPSNPNKAEPASEKVERGVWTVDL